LPTKPAARRRRLFLAVFAVPVFLFLLHHFHLIDFHELDAVDLRFRLRGQKDAHPDIVLVEIDDASLAAIGQWPWPRSVHAVLLDVLARYEPRLVFFDVLFTESSPDASEDEKLQFAIQKVKNVILPFYYYSEKPFGAFFPILPLRSAAQNIGYVNIHPERDGLTRRMRAFMKTGKETFYHPAVLTMLLQMGEGDPFNRWFQNLPLDGNGNFWINYPGSIRSFKRVSFTEVIDAVGTERDPQMRELFFNRVILVGHTATGTTDLEPTPFSPADPGVAIQASALHTILGGYFLRSINGAIHFLILVLAAMIVVWISQLSSPKWGLLLVLGLMVFYALCNFALFFGVGWILPLFVPMVAMGLTYVLMLFLKYIEIRLQDEMLNRELQTAARIQETFLPQTQPLVPSLDVAFECRFAKQVGGDLYDWIDFGDGRIGICVGDVSGKGVPAALYMARAISEFRKDDKAGEPPGKVCGNLNTLLTRGSAPGMFLTLLYAVVSPRQKEILFASAGHEPMIFYHNALKQCEILKGAQGRPLGLFEEVEYETSEVPFQEGDAFLLISDGVKELRNPRGEEFGLERLKSFFEGEARHRRKSTEIIHNLFQAMQSYQKGMAAHDDRTLVCVRFSES
jgi:serine phosphatase RsbU (regulator of sigma subunit)